MQYTNIYNLPQSLVDVIVKLTYDKSQTDTTKLSVTSLINPPIINLLQIRHWNELTEDVSEHLWRITGNAYHYILSKTSDKNRLIEERLEAEVDGIKIIGKFDIYDDITKSVEDYKITSVWRVKDESKDEWEAQLNCYDWLLAQANFKVEKAYINAILRDWRKKEAKKYSDYPPIPFKRIAIPLWNFKEQDEYVRNRVKIYKEALNLKDEEIPVCSAIERWQTEDIWAIYKGNNKTATKLCETEKEAIEYASAIKFKTRIEKRPGVDNKCMDYCLVNKFCPYWKQNYERKES
jgi:hypothetical protein